MKAGHKMMAEMKAQFGSLAAKMNAWLEGTKDCHEVMKARIEPNQKRREAKSTIDVEESKATDLEANSEEIQPELMHQAVPKEEAEIMGALEDRYWNWHLPVGCRRQPNKWTQGDGGSLKR
jgi:hypothetical protein